MADSQDNLTPAEQKKLAELEQQLGKEKTVKPSAKTTATQNTKSPEKPQTKSSAFATKSDSNSQPPLFKPNQKVKSNTGTLWFFTVINLLLIIAIIAAGYWAWLKWQSGVQQQTDVITNQQKILAEQKSAVEQQQAEIAQSIDSNQLAKDDLQQQNQALQNQIQSLLEEYQLLNAQVAVNQRNLADVSGRRPADWMLAEADYLVRMAGRKLWLEHDVKTATMMLQSADRRIQDLDDPSLLPIRALLAEDIQSLQQINQVSTSSIALALGAMMKQVDNLPLLFFKRPEAESSEKELSESIDDWRANLARNWQEFKDNFFSFKQVTTQIKPFMSEQQQWLSKEQLRFALMQAQIAALQEDSMLYQEFIQSAFGLVSEYFDPEKTQVIQFTQALAELKATDFARQYPEQFNASGLLKDVIEQRLDSRFVNGSN